MILHLSKVSDGTNCIKPQECSCKWTKDFEAAGMVQPTDDEGNLLETFSPGYVLQKSCLNW